MSTRDVKAPAAAWKVQDDAAYAYLLGCYLGDGHITHKAPGTWTLRLSCDRAYPEIEAEMAAAMVTTFPGANARRRAGSKGAVNILSLTHPGVMRAFPQHGPGRKHNRPIRLEPWQRRITHDHPAPLVRGMIHSDGCRAINRFRTRLPSGRVAEYAYTRYFFSNLSEDIRELFTEHCQILGIRVTQSNSRNLSIAHRTSVALLEKIVGPKR